MQYKDDLDDKILKFLMADEIGFYALSKKLNVNHPTLANHLKRLKDEGMINCQPPSKIGGRGKYELTPSGRFSLDYSIWEGVQTKREDRDNKGKRAKKKEAKHNRLLLQLLMSIASTGSKRSHLKSPGEMTAGDVGIPYLDKSGKIQFQFYSSETIRGVSIDDIIGHKPSQLEFAYAESSNVKVKDLFKKLSGGLHVLEPVAVNDIKGIEGIRYDIADPVLKTFLSDCLMILGLVVARMEYTWTFIRPMKRKPSTEVSWYSDIFGPKIAAQFFSSLSERRKTDFKMKEEHYRHQVKQAIEDLKRINDPSKVSKIVDTVSNSYNLYFGVRGKKNHAKALDQLIRRYLDKFEKDYKDTFEKLKSKYPFISLFRKCMYPEFLQSLHEKMQI